MNNLPEYLEITDDIASGLEALQANHDASRWLVLTDDNTVKYCLPKISSLLPQHEVLTIPSGESQKNLSTCSIIWDTMTNMQLDRRAFMLNLGGGVIGDMGGFCAATYKRGIGFANIPTTLLAQVDASIGGKLGIDFKGYKNHIGLFRNPEKVIIYRPFLETLPVEELRSGFAEVIKHCLIRDAAYWKQLLKSADWKETITEELVQHSIKVKSSIVDEDPFEKGLRKILNYGHTAGHAIESYFLENDKPVLHGEAVAAGMIIENIISNAKGNLNASEMGEINDYIMNVFGLLEIRESDIKSIVQLALQDKKNKNGVIRASLLNQIGEASWDIPITRDELEKALRIYISL